MIYALYGAALALTWFLICNLLLSALVLVLSERISAGIAGCAPVTRARVFLAVRLLPAVGSIAFVAGLCLPSFLRFEPRDFDEAFGVTTTTLSLAAAALIAGGARAGFRAWRESYRHARRWLQAATRLDLAGAPAPVYCLDAPAPAMTLVGVLRPRLFVARALLDTLTAEELEAALAHEAAHIRSRDNLTRLVVRALPDIAGTWSAIRTLEHRWAMAEEQSADGQGARTPAARLALASALVKAVRADLAAPPALAIASPLVGSHALASRIERLVDAAPSRPVSISARAIGWIAAAASLSILVAGYEPLLQSVHRVSEIVVHALP